MASECAYGAPEQTALAPFPCLGPCGCWLPASGECLECWAARKTYPSAEVRMLPPADPRRRPVRDPRRRAGR